jgi:hypothetical protein
LSTSIGEPWPGIDQSDEAGPEGHSVITARSPRRGSRIERIGEGISRTGRGMLVGEALGPSSSPPIGFGGSFVRDRAAQVLEDAPGAILPRMRWSFVDRQYSPSTGMNQSE